MSPRIEEIHIQDSGSWMEFTKDLFSHGTSKPIVEINLKPQLGNICSVVNWGDFHNANLGHNEKLLKDTRDYILDNGIYVLSPGTDPEMALRGSKSEDWKYRKGMTPAEEFDEQRRFLQPVADAGLLLGMTDDNHGFRWWHTTGKSFARSLCESLDVPDAYLGWQGFLRLKVGDVSYEVFVFHGKSAAMTAAGRLRAAMKLADHNPTADIFCSGHVHHGTAYDLTRLKQSDDGAEMGIKQRLFVVCGSFLSYFGTYPERLLYSPGKMGAKIIHLRSDVKYAVCEVGGFL